MVVTSVFELEVNLVGRKFHSLTNGIAVLQDHESHLARSEYTLCNTASYRDVYIYCNDAVWKVWPLTVNSLLTGGYSPVTLTGDTPVAHIYIYIYIYIQTCIYIDITIQYNANRIYN